MNNTGETFLLQRHKRVNDSCYVICGCASRPRRSPCWSQRSLFGDCRLKPGRWAAQLRAWPVAWPSLTVSAAAACSCHVAHACAVAPIRRAYAPFACTRPTPGLSCSVLSCPVVLSTKSNMNDHEQTDRQSTVCVSHYSTIYYSYLARSFQIRDQPRRDHVYLHIRVCFSQNFSLFFFLLQSNSNHRRFFFN